MPRLEFYSINKFISMLRVSNILRVAVFYIGMGITSCQNVDNLSNYQIFNYNDDAGVATLDPALARSQSEIWLVSQLYNTLIDLDNDLKPTPGLAKKWSVEDGGKRIRFTLKKNIPFCEVDYNSVSKSVSGRFMNANDAVASLRRVSNPGLGSPGFWIFANLDTSTNRGIQALNDSTMLLHLLKPQASMVSLLATSYCSILPKELCVQEKSFVARNPLGTGPFFLKRWEPDVKMVLRKNHRYFEKDSKGVALPYLDAIAVSFIKNKQTAFMQFVAGKFDFFNGLEGSFKDELLTDSATLKPKYQKKFNLLVTPFLNTEYIGMYIDSTKPAHQILLNSQFRKALSLAVPREDLVKFVRNGLGDPANDGFVPSVLLPKSPENYPATPQALHSNVSNISPQQIQSTKAKHPQECIKEAKFLVAELRKKGVEIPVLTLTTNADYLDMAVFLQKAWKDIGVPIQIDLQTSAMLRQRRNEGTLQLFRGSWIADYPDAESFLACFYGPYCSPNGPNYTHFTSVVFDNLYQKIESGLGGPEDRNNAIHAALSVLNSQYPVIPLYYDKSLRLFHPWVQGLGNDANNRLILKRVKIKHSPE